MQSPALDSTRDHIRTKSDTQPLPSVTGGNIRLLCKKKDQNKK